MIGRWLLAALLVATSAAAAPPQARVGERTVRDDVFPRRPVTFPDGVTAQPDIEYANLTGYRPLLLDLYRPRARGPKPLVIWVHGGGWNRGDSRTSGAFEDFPAVLASLAARGFVVASVNYRLSGEARFPAQVQDVKAATRYLRAHAGEYGIDPGRVYLWGGSAGGHLAALGAVSCGEAAFAPAASTGRLSGAEARTATAPAGSDCVQGAAIWYGVFDLSDARPLNVSGVLGCAPETCGEAAAAASPVTYVDRSDPPMLLLHGDTDEEVSVRQAEAMTARLRGAGVPVQTVILPGVGHGWIGATPRATRAANLEALERTFGFFETLARRP